MATPMLGRSGELAPPPPRLFGVDAARGLALIGMMAVHVLPGPVIGSSVLTSTVYRLAEGRAAALFAVVAGVSLVLSRATRTQIAVRAAVVAAIGLGLGTIPSPIAIILTVYGLLFVLVLPFLRLPATVLAALAVLWAVLSPLASQGLRMHGLDGWPVNPAWPDLLPPLDFAQNLLLTGYYPAVTWMTYLLAGLAIGRFLTGRDVPSAACAGRWIVFAGLVTAAAGWAVGLVVFRAAGGLRGLTASLEPWSLLIGRGDHLLDETFYGTTPITSWWWVGVNGPHSGSIADLAQTTGSALVLLGLALVLAPWAAMHIAPRFRPFVSALIAAGAMTLSLYTLHVLIMDVVASLPLDRRPGPWPLLLAQVVLALLAAWAWGAPRQRGPLEDFVSVMVRTVAGTVARKVDGTVRGTVRGTVDGTSVRPAADR